MNKKQSALITKAVFVTIIVVIVTCLFNFNDSKILSDLILRDNVSLHENNSVASSTKVTLTTQTDIISADAVAPTVGSAMTQDDINLIMLSNKDAWELISNGVYSANPTGSFLQEQSKLVGIRSAKSTFIEVDVWYWEDPSDNTNLNKTTVKKTFEVNKEIASLFEHAFQDAYDDPEKPVYNIADTSGGTWAPRGKSNNPNRHPSSHSYGCCIDINPATSISVNGRTYGNGQPQTPIPYDVWKTLPETHLKYHLMYKECAWVRHFEHYGFVWGGEFSQDSVDPMHISWIGEREDTRAWGQENYNNFK